MKTGWQLIAVIPLALAACAPTAPYVWVDDRQTGAKPDPPAFYLVPGDEINVEVWKQPDLSGNKKIRSDGKISMSLVGEVHAGGLTLKELAEVLTRRLDGVVVEPNVTVALLSMGPRVVSVMGEVNQPGFVDLTNEKNLLHVLAETGGLTEFASDDIYVLRVDGASERIRISYHKLKQGIGKAISFRLRPGDTIIVE